MSLFGHLFRRKPASTIIQDRRVDNEEWQAGDLARCVIHNWRVQALWAPQFGEVLRVAEVSEGLAIGAPWLIIGLKFEGRSDAWQCTCFRKVRPASGEFSKQVRACRPKQKQGEAA